VGGSISSICGGKYTVATQSRNSPPNARLQSLETVMDNATNNAKLKLFSFGKIKNREI